MNILIIGAGGREHCLAWKLKQSPLCSQLFIAPGNAGTTLCGTNLDIKVSDFEKMEAACLKHSIDMIVVGPEEPLVKGIYDHFSSNPKTAHIHIIGPSAAAAQLEGSKAFAKAFMQRHSVPTAAYQEFTADNFEEGIAYIKAHALPIVLKADGLAAGKGVLICQTHIEATAEFELMIRRSKFGEAGNKVVVEAFLEGIEMSVFALTDGKAYVLLPEAKDYKRIGEGDTGLNTGGMGAVSPLPFFNDSLKQKVIEKVIQPTINGLHKENMKYTGFVFFGLMIKDGEPMVIEYNCRMGDPETEVVIPRLQNDLVALLLAAAENKLEAVEIITEPRAAVAIVAVSGGYPGDYEKGLRVRGLNTIAGDETIIFHSGTIQTKDLILTNGGRVLAVTSFGNNIEAAGDASKNMLDEIYFDGITYRRDIGYEFV